MFTGRLLAISVTIMLLLSGGVGLAAPKSFSRVDVRPSVFNARTDAQATAVCGSAESATGLSDSQVAEAKWQANAGIDQFEPRQSFGFGLVLEKKVATSECAAAQADIIGVARQRVQRLGFTVRADAYCGAGAPRFNLSTRESGDTTLFFGCAGMTTVRTFVDRKRVAWVVKEADLGAVAGETITDLGLIQDEQGRTVLDDIQVNDEVVGGPSGLRSGQTKKSRH